MPDSGVRGGRSGCIAFSLHLHHPGLRSHSQSSRRQIVFQSHVSDIMSSSRQLLWLTREIVWCRGKYLTLTSTKLSPCQWCYTFLCHMSLFSIPPGSPKLTDTFRPAMRIFMFLAFSMASFASAFMVPTSGRAFTSISHPTMAPSVSRGDAKVRKIHDANCSWSRPSS